MYVDILIKGVFRYTNYFCIYSWGEKNNCPSLLMELTTQEMLIKYSMTLTSLHLR